MISHNLIVGLASLSAFVTVGAAPTAAGGSIAKDCINIRLRDSWLIADCLTGKDKDSRIQSSVWLSSKITNREATLEWKVDGAYANSCIDCKIIDNEKLNCHCRPSGGQRRFSNVTLDEHIRNYNGHLLSDLAGPPQIPSTSSTVKFPDNLSWGLSFGGKSCWSTESDFCKKYANDPPVTDLTCPANNYWTSSTGAPTKCATLRVPVSAPYWEQFRSLKASGAEGAWEFSVYDDTECVGQVQAKISGSQVGQCVNWEKAGLGVKVKPLWNADIS